MDLHCGFLPEVTGPVTPLAGRSFRTEAVGFLWWPHAIVEENILPWLAQKCTFFFARFLLLNGITIREGFFF